MKRCKGCGGLLPETAYHRNRWPKPEGGYRYGLRANCKRCEAIRRRKNHLKASYGISHEELKSLISSQGGECPICLNKISDLGTTAQTGHIDHCHTTNVIRGVLCSVCNRALGLFQDKVDNLRRAAAYLERFNKGTGSV